MAQDSVETSYDKETAHQDQVDYWNGEGGDKFARHQHVLDESLRPFGRAAMQAADIRPGDAVLDIGCGCGDTSIEIAHKVGAKGRVVGIDLSETMLERAEKEAAQDNLSNCFFEHRDAEAGAIHDDSFDVAYSRFGVMFFGDPVKAFRNIADALHAQGRLGFICWQPMPENDWIFRQIKAIAPFVEIPKRAPDEPGPFSFGDPERVKTILSAAGFTDIKITPYAGSFALGGGKTVPEAVQFAQSMGPASDLLAQADPGNREKALAALAAALEPLVTPKGVFAEAKAWIVGARKE